eukprot:7671756-Alexandrium_andersonii.AAC.1
MHRPSDRPRGPRLAAAPHARARLFPLWRAEPQFPGVLPCTAREGTRPPPPSCCCQRTFGPGAFHARAPVLRRGSARSCTAGRFSARPRPLSSPTA